MNCNLTLKEVSSVTEESMYIFSPIEDLDKYENSVAGVYSGGYPSTYSLYYTQDSGEKTEENENL